jgi:uncharacterized protein
MEAPTITPRDVDVDLAQVPRLWVAGLPWPTHLVNGVNLLFPLGERFFVRSVYHYLDAVEDPRLRAAVQAFARQEGRHAHAHDRVNQMLRDHGLAVDDFLARYKQVLGAVERALPPQLRLAATAATEHYTAILAEGAFSSPMLDHAAPAMRLLLAWHAMEEIEHRAVAFDVLRAVNPSYPLRMAGMVLATAMLAGCWAWATWALLRQEPTTDAKRRRPAELAQREPILRRVFLRGLRAYVRPDFHPQQLDLDGLAARWMASHLTDDERARLRSA